MTKPQLPNLQQTVAITILIKNISGKILTKLQLLNLATLATVKTLTSFEFASSHTRVTSIMSQQH